MYTPQITVLLPVHNGMPFLLETIDSLRKQTFRNFEALILDDGSTDTTPNYAKSIDDRRFRYIRLERIRLPAALNYGVHEARSPLIARIDADDIAYPQRLVRQFQFMERNPRCVLAGCDYLRIDSSGERLGSHKSIESDAAIRYQMLFTTPFLHPGVIMRRDAVMAAGLYNTDFRVAQDYELWTRMALQGQLGNVPEILMRYRCNQQGASARNRETQVANASLSAAAFAVAAGIDVQRDDWLRLHEFLVRGEVDDSCSPRRIVETFILASNRFRPLCRECVDEFQRIQQKFRSILRWRLSDRIKERRNRGQTTFAWHMARIKTLPESRVILRRLVATVFSPSSGFPRPTFVQGTTSSQR